MRKKVLRLSESELVRLIKRVINEREDHYMKFDREPNWMRSDRMRVPNPPDDFDYEEEFDDFDKYNERFPYEDMDYHPMMMSRRPDKEQMYMDSKMMFDKFRPLKVRSRSKK
jgi:hypothetical protein